MASTYDEIKACVGDRLDNETIAKCAVVLEAMPKFTPSEKPSEKLVYCSLQDIVEYQEANA